MNYYQMYQTLGMHRNVNPMAIQKGEWKKIVNWDVAKIGCATKRDGYTAILNVPGNYEVLSLIPLQVGSIRKLIMITAEGKLYCKDPVVDTTWGSALYTGLNTSARWTGALLHDDEGSAVMLLGNGYQTLKTYDVPSYGSELLSSSNWTSTDWTGSWSGGWDHTTGNTSILSNTLAAVIGTKYKISYTVTGRTAGTFSITFGGKTKSALSSTGKFVPTAVTTGNLQITPTSDFDGAIVLSIISITGVANYIGESFEDATTDGAPLAPYWTSFQERIYAAGVPIDKDVLHWCSIGNALNWSLVSPSDSSSLNIDKFFGGVIQNIKMLNDRVVIWKEGMIKRWDEEYLRTVLASDGLDAPYSVAEINGMAFSLDRNAIRLYDGSAPQELTSKIEDLIFGIDFGATNTPRICGEVFKKKYYLSVGTITDEDGETITNAWIVYDYNKNSFWLYSLADQATAMCQLKCSDGVQRMYFGGTTGSVFQMFSGDTDNGTEIEAILEGHIFYVAGTEQFINPGEIIVASKFGHEMTVQLRDDYNDEAITIGEHDKPVSNNLTDELGNNVLGLAVTITHSSKGKPIFYGFSLGFDIEGEKKMTA
jgi:hypothetical protein